MIGTRITHTEVSDPRDVLQYGVFNALYFAFLPSLVLFMSYGDVKSAALLALVVYVWYMLNQHRKMFVLNMAPDLSCLFGRFFSDQEKFLNLVIETDTTSEMLEKSFWRYFYSPIWVILFLLVINSFLLIPM